MVVHLESWVTQQYKEIGFGEDGNGPFIGKSALKQRLINRYPEHRDRIRQLVNAIKVPATPRRPVPAMEPPAISSQIGERTDPPASPSNLKLDTTSMSAAPPQPTRVSSGENSKIGASSPDLDSGFASYSEGENAPSTFKSKIPPNMNFQSHSPRSPDGGASLGAFTSTILRTGKDSETSVDLGITANSSNAKIMELKRFVSQMEDLASTPHHKPEDTSGMLNIQLGLLNISSADKDHDKEGSISGIKSAVLFSAYLLEHPKATDELPQYGLLGSSDPTVSTGIVDSRLFLNTNTPFSAFVCGVQGSGKSHTTACMIENCLIPSPVLGALQKPLSALVFNFAEYTSSSNFRPCELAFLATPSPELPSRLGAKKVSVLVSPSNYLSMKALYTQIPGVTIQPFKLKPKDLNISTMLTLMSVNQTQAAPLYMGIVTKILRDMASKAAGTFNYPEFRRQLDDAGLDRTQREFLKQRLDLLESYLDLDGSTKGPDFAPGEITIVDLSCPFMDASTACVLFKVGMGLYLESDSSVGKVIVLDEAHKYMTDTPASTALTESLMGVIRQQRHYGARVIISTQEPTISPKLIDLCSITVIHRFSSPDWLGVLQRHLPIFDEAGDRSSKADLQRDIMRLRTGEALVFAPSAILGASDDVGERRLGTDSLIKMRMRKRVTWDGGKSVFCI